VRSLRSAEVSTVPVVTENPLGVDVETSVVDNTYSTQPPPRSGRGSWERERAVILGLDELTVVPSAVERQQSEHKSQTSAYVRCKEGPQEQEEESAMMAGKAVPYAVPNGVRSSDSQSLSRVNERMDENRHTIVAYMEHDDDNSWNCRYDNLPPHVCATGRIGLPLAVCAGPCTSVEQPTTAGSETTSRHTAPRQQYTQLYSSTSGSSLRQNVCNWRIRCTFAV